jgi:type II secretory pathway component GspD/PulD (secretin)
MRRNLPGAAWVVAVLVAAVLTSAAPAERRVVGRYAVYSPSKKKKDKKTRVSPASFVRVTVTVNGVPMTVLVPDGGSATVASFSDAAEGRTEYGVPGLGKVPYFGRLFRNVGYGRQMRTRRAIVSVRVIDLREEEYRQTGVRSR